MRGIAVLILLIATGTFLLAPNLFRPLLQPLAGQGAAIYDRADLGALALSHLGLVAAALIPSAIVAIGFGIFVTRPAGAEFLPLSQAITSFGQTFPPVAVLALTVPMLGFGARPTILALFLYGLLPIFENTRTAFATLNPSVREAAAGIGMTSAQRLWRVELPLALPLILQGVRISAIIALSTATIGSTIAARSLGEVIIAGLNTQNLALVMQGGLLTGALAVLVSEAFGFAIRQISIGPGTRESA
ncbi:ABC transporter permease [Falsirhodobacter halotolerans]|uniref:ABC transporter permease n=1 Tax=Falsirhodobacter halotolerans TaxID=1146892 RepID=UPI001FD57F94|nr:ABC transporter permease [Falsirhodobacter halotolerans]MCJ8141157.1 ABC transporter permease [Falsirhodobacter halotolerans]